MNYFFYFLMIIYFGYMVLLFYGLFFKIRVPQIGNQPLPYVSILKPVCDLEPESFENCASFCEQEGVGVELIFGIQNPNDAVISLVQDLQRLYPHVHIQSVICDRVLAKNPKVNTLLQIAPYAQYAWILMSDSDTWVDRDYLRTMMSSVTKDTGAVTNLYRSKVSSRVGLLEAVRSAGECNVAAIIAHGLTNTFLGGWSILIRQRALKDIGGLDAIKDFIGEDFVLAKLLKQWGWKIKLAVAVSVNVQANESIKALWDRYIRWNKGVLNHDFCGYSAMVIGYIPLFLFLGLFLGAVTPGALATIWGMRYLMAIIVGRCFLKDKIMIPYLWILPFSDLFGVLIWFRSFFGRSFMWRGKKYHVSNNGIIIVGNTYNRC